jgi:translocation and assembly module TamA
LLRRRRILTTAERGLLNKAPILLAALAGIMATPLAAQPPIQTSPPLQDADDPIVPDSAFEEALPSLDPALTEPLEPIDPNASPFPPVPGPVEDVPLGDPELSAPLPPLATFDVRPVEEAALTEEEEQALRIRYTLVVEGLNEVGLESRFRDLSALEDARGEAVNGAMIAARAEEDEALAVRLLRSEGYYDAVASSSIEQLPEPGQLRVTIVTAPGERYNLGAIAISGPETEPPGLARESLLIETGQPIVAANVEAAEANVLLRLPQQGYPFPEIGLRDILLDPETHVGDYTLPLNPGPRATFAGFTTEGDLAFDAEHVAVLSRFERGDLYDRRRVDDLREAMVATRLFNSVSAEPVLTGETAPDGSEYVNILVRQDAGPARSIDGNFGYNTGEGLRIEGAWEHRNLFRPEGALRVAAIAGTAEQNLSVRFRRNNWGQRDRALLLQLEAGQRDYEAFQGYTTRLYGLIARESTPIWQKVWTYAYGAEILATNEARDRRARLSLSDAYFIGGLIGQLGYDRSNSLLDPTKGFRLLARINPEASLGNGTYYYARNLIEGSAYYPATDQLVIAGRARFGSIYGIPRDALAPSRRFYAGGGGSVRGFGFQELGPRQTLPNPEFDPTDPDEEDDPTISVPLGGRSLAEFAIEGRYRFGNYGVVGFVDAGQVYESQVPSFSSMRFGVGVGGRLYTNFGPIRLDIATPIGRREGESRLSLYVSIGQAF